MSDEPFLIPEIQEPPEVMPVIFNKEIQWSRIVVLKKPTCGHCQMLAHAGKAVPVYRARWTRIGLDGSVLELCEGHRAQQWERDQK